MNDFLATIEQLCDQSAHAIGGEDQLRDFAQSIQSHDVKVIWIAESDGQLLAAYRADECMTLGQVRELAQQVSPVVCEQPWHVTALTDAPMPCQLLTVSMGDFVMGMHACDEASFFDVPAEQINAWRACGRAIGRCAQLEQRATQSEVRVKHLESERRTLKENYSRTLSAVLLEREQRLAEQSQYTERLEKEVAERAAELRQALQQAELANRAKSAFLANMSHEIRTPLTAILGFTDQLIDVSQGREQSLEWLDIIQRNGNHLLQVINDILDLSKIEAGKLEIERLKCNPLAIAQEVQEMFRGMARQKNLDFNVHCDPAVPITIETDPTRMRQILTNLVGNALKFTTQGSIHIELGMTPYHELKIDVVDTGAGMSEKQLERIFEAFSQADVSTTRKFGGTGLGLTICRKLANALGGELHAQSELGKGTRMTAVILAGRCEYDEEARLQAAATPTNKAIAKKEETLKGRRILVAEDGPDNRALIQVILAKAGVQLSLVENGQLAVDAAIKASDADEPFDIILMDMQMPVLDGYKASTQLREMGYKLPIIALTANAMSTDRQKCIDAGCDDFASKPINRKKLLDTLTQYLPATKEPSAEAAEVALPANELQATVPDPLPTPGVNLTQQAETSPLYSEMADDPDMLELIQDYVSKLPQRIADIEDALSTDNLETLTRLAHQLKGSAGGYGFRPITEVAAELETAAKESADPFSLNEAVRELAELCNRAASTHASK